jgi:ferredoxin
MPKIKITTDDLTLDLPKDSKLIDMCEEHDTSILFGCRDGACGACIIRVKESPENLSKMEEDEKDFLETMAADDDERLACQCSIHGDVTIEVSE